ncbi:M48 family metallopeptidase [Patescibacteria group bacterium]
MIHTVYDNKEVKKIVRFVMYMKYENVEVIRSKRKSISIRVTDEGVVVIRAPKKVSEQSINKFIRKSEKWIDKKLVDMNLQNSKLDDYQFTKKQINSFKKRAKVTIKDRLDELSIEVGIKYNTFRLSGAKKRWGSCSNKRTVSINWRLILAPPEIIDYVIIHELIHLKHMNHSKRFWKEVQKHIPDYKEKRKWLNENDFILRVGETIVKD